MVEGMPGTEPWNWASPKLKTPPLSEVSQYPPPSGVRTRVDTVDSGMLTPTASRL